MTASAELTPLAEQRPEPGRCWIRYTPKTWPAPEDAAGPWIHLGQAAWGPSALRRPVPAQLGNEILERVAGAEGRSVDDLVYLPPVPPTLAEARTRLAARLQQRGVPVLMQTTLEVPPDHGAAPKESARVEIFEAEGPPARSLEGAAFGIGPLWSVLDPTPLLLARAAGALSMEAFLSRLRAATTPREPSPRGAGSRQALTTLLWPIVAGISDDPALEAEACRTVAEAGAKSVLALAPVLAPEDRREILSLVEALASPGRSGDPESALEGLYRVLFHGPAPEERGFARLASAAGLEPLVPRPLPALAGTLRNSRYASGRLLQMADLWLRLGRRESTGAALFRAARWIETARYDPEALVREGNLGLLTSVHVFNGQAETIGAVLVELFGDSSEGPFEDLRRDYLS